MNTESLPPTNLERLTHTHFDFKGYFCVNVIDFQLRSFKEGLMAPLTSTVDGNSTGLDSDKRQMNTGWVSTGKLYSWTFESLHFKSHLSPFNVKLEIALFLSRSGEYPSPDWEKKLQAESGHGGL